VEAFSKHTLVMLIRSLVVTGLIALAVARPSAQTPAALPALTDSATAIVSGTVTTLSSASDGVAIYTYVTLQVAEVLKGSLLPGESIVLKQMGGFANGVGLHIDGQARFAVGDDVLVFLAVRPRDGTLYTVGLAEGAWPASELPAVRAVVMAQPQRDAAVSQPFVTRPPELASGDLTAGIANFTFLESGPARWHQADEEIPIPVDFATVPAGLPGGGLAALDAAIGAWNGVGTALTLTRANSGNPTCPADAFSGNGRIAFYWDDPCADIADNDAVTFGIGGGYFTSGSVRTVNGVVFAQFLQGIAILNNVGPHRAAAACLQDAATHVLGHAVGLGHSSDSSAVMFATLRAGCNSGTSGLGNDDIAGLRAIYPALPGGGLPPERPTAITANVSGSTVVLNWTPATTGGVVLSYVVEAGSSPGLANLAVLTVTGSVPSLTVNAVPPGAYYVRVRARNALGTSTASPEIVVNVAPCVLPGAPSGLAYSAADNIVSITWTPPSSSPPIQGYILSAGFGQGQSNALVTQLGPTADFSGFAPAGNYFVRVQARNACGVGPASADLLVTVQSCTAPPSAPTNLRFTKAGNVVTLNWNAPASGTPSQYRLVVGSFAGSADLLVVNTGNNSTSFQASAPNGTYFVRVQAINLCGTSTSSNEVSVTVP
jgi:hypothetical protein